MKRIALISIVAASAITAWASFGEEPTPKKLLFLGNSITWHPPAADIGWSGNWGMAASCEENDYVHRVAAGYAAAYGVAPTLRVRSIVAGFEGNGAYASWTAANDSDYQQDLAFQPDVVVIAIGENLGSYDATVFREKFLAYCQGFASLSPKPTMLIRAPFWNAPAVAAIEQAVAEEVGAKFINVGDIGADVSNQAQGLFSHSGVASHPGDKGMKAIAERMMTALEVPRVECREVSVGTTDSLAIARGIVNVTQTERGSCYAFCTSGTFTPREDLVLFHALVVGGGGSGGWLLGGGGGGGGVVPLGYFEDGKKIILKKGVTYSITVGAGGGNRVAGDLSSSGTSRGYTECVDGLPGEPSSLTIGGQVYTASGGGYGASWFLWDEGAKKGVDAKYVPGGVGACGGGSSDKSGAGGMGTMGGNGGASVNTAAGGGGGMCGAGADGCEIATDNLISGDGGAGFASAITGTTVIYGAGGGGGGQNGVVGRNVAAGKAGGVTAGAGGYGTVGGDASPNTGSGGGGGGWTGWSTMYRGGNGGSGTVILSVMTVADFERDVGSMGFVVDGVYTVSKRSKDYIVTLKSSGSLKAFSKLKILRALVVGGGGSGGWMVGGGGGGGEVVEYRPEKGSELCLDKGTVCPVAIGQGGGNRNSVTLLSGDARFKSRIDGMPGGASSIRLGSATNLVAAGGGYGAGWLLWHDDTGKATDEPVPGGDGACGGGSCGGNASGGVGSAGGNGGANNGAGGGGGGMGGNGTDGFSYVYAQRIPGQSGAGGAGVTNDITGADCVYGAGGGAGGLSYSVTILAGAAGAETAGAGGFGKAVGGNAVDGFGGGGGGGGCDNWSGAYAGGNGGDGAVILVVRPVKTGLAVILR